MDREQPFVGDHSPLVHLDGLQARGIRQAGLAVRKGPTETEQALELIVTGRTWRPRGRCSGWHPRSSTPPSPGQRPEVKIEEQRVAGLPASGRYAPFSVSVLVIPVRRSAAALVAEPVTAVRPAAERRLP